MIFTSLVRLVAVTALCFSLACSRDDSLYQELQPDEDGVVGVEIPDDGEKTEAENIKIENKLSATETKLIKTWHEGQFDKLSFVVVDVEKKKILRSYFADKPQRLASVTKISTALAALENLASVSVNQVAGMLKISNNGRASDFIRKAAKAIDGLQTPGAPYSQKHSCPDAFLQEEEAGQVVLGWLQDQMPNLDWSEASLNDGAGCHYDNFMSSLQVIRILQFADSKGSIYGGKSFEELLAINGIDGTLKNKNLDNKGVIFGKTGTLRPNANLSGYFYVKRSNKMVKHYFSIFVEKKGGGQYSVRARRLIEELLRYWINYYASNEDKGLASF